MSHSTMTSARRRGPGAIGLALGMLVAGAQAQPGPLSFLASPEIYRIAAENEQYRIIVVSWKPGQRDAPHSHPEAGVYFLTDCSLRFFAPDGTSRDGSPKAGYAVVQQAIASHHVENIGATDCRLVMFEPKQAAR